MSAPNGLDHMHENEKLDMPEPQELFHIIARDLPNAVEGKLFGALCIKSINGKAAAIFWEDNMLFKLGAKDQRSALELDGARVGTHLYAPDKPMKGWVLVPAQHSDKWTGLIQKALANLETLGL